jgi:hypothetical protein
VKTVWYVLRQGMPGRPERVLYRGPNERTAQRIYTRTRAAMRQGSLRFGETRPDVDPWPPVAAQDLGYYSAPMARTRW